MSALPVKTGSKSSLRARNTDVLLNHTRDQLFAGCAYDAFHFFARAEKNQSWNPFYPIALCCGSIFIDIHFDHAGVFTKLFGDRVNRRRKHAARSTPLSPKI